MVKNKVKISALGTANHIPFIFNIFGNINKPIVINPNVRRKDILQTPFHLIML